MSTGQTLCNSCSATLTAEELAAPGSAVLACESCKRAAKLARVHRWQPVMQWEDGREGLRLASTAPVPWDSSNVVMIRVTHDGQVSVVHTVSGKRAMLEAAARSDMLMVAWPGERRQDVFIVDDRTSARKALR